MYNNIYYLDQLRHVSHGRIFVDTNRTKPLGIWLLIDARAMEGIITLIAVDH